MVGKNYQKKYLIFFGKCTIVCADDGNNRWNKAVRCKLHQINRKEKSYGKRNSSRFQRQVLYMW